MFFFLNRHLFFAENAIQSHNNVKVLGSNGTGYMLFTVCESNFMYNVEHCGASVSKQCTTALTATYVAKALPVNYQITAHRPFMHGMWLKQGL